MIYNGEHSVTFINDEGEQKNTWTDWLLVPTSRPVIGSPPVKKMGVDIPGRNGTLDITGKITSNVCYENRQGTLEFLIDHENPDYTSWVVTKNKIMSFLHGKHMKLILEDEPAYYYDGRMEVEEFKANSDWSTISIAYDVLPIKYSTASSLDAWKWDPFSFVNGVIRNGEDYQITVSPNHAGRYTITDINTPSRVKITIEPISKTSVSSILTPVTIAASDFDPNSITSKDDVVIFDESDTSKISDKDYFKYLINNYVDIYKKTSSDISKISLEDATTGDFVNVFNQRGVYGYKLKYDSGDYYIQAQQHIISSSIGNINEIYIQISSENYGSPYSYELGTKTVTGELLSHSTQEYEFLQLNSPGRLSSSYTCWGYANYKLQQTHTYSDRSLVILNAFPKSQFVPYEPPAPPNYSIGFVMTPRNKTLQKRTINMDTIYQPVPNTVTYDLIPGEDFVINWQYDKLSDNDPDLKVRFEFEEGAL